MKVAQINAVYGILSTGRTSMELSKFLEAKGHISKVFYGASQADYGKNVVFMGSQLSHKLHAFTARLTGDAGHGSFRATRKLIRDLDEFQPDIVHLRNLHSNYVNIRMLLEYLAEKDIPTIQHLHDCFNFTGGCVYYTLNQCNQWCGNECRNCKHLHRGTNYIFANPAHNNFEEKVRLYGAIPRLAVVGVSKWVADEARKSRVFDNAKIITHIYNSINLDIFKPQAEEHNQETKHRLGLDNKHLILGVAANWIPAKGLNDLIELSKILPNNIQLVLVGSMPNEIQLPDNITSIARTDNVQDLVDLYSAADVFVHLSMEETFGKVTAEALSCGTPAVVYDSTASPELVDDSTGRVVRPGSVNDVYDKISSLLSIDKTKITEDCRNRVVSFFNIETNYNELLRLYETMCK